MVRPVSFKGFQKGFQGVSLRGFRGFQFFLWELCVCIKYLSLGDPCMGSGHILVYAFDVLMDIYRSVGYTDRDAVQSIVQNNLYGLDIDDRAAQLAYFAVMMKACEYDRRFLRRGVQPHVCAIAESAPLAELSPFGAEKALAQTLLDTFRDAKEYGSILHVPLSLADIRRLADRTAALQSGQQDTLLSMADNAQAAAAIQPLLAQAQILARQYDAVITNPPYMGASGMGARLSEYVKTNYPDSKSDLFAVFIERCGDLLDEKGYQAMITQHAWMFLSSFERLRAKLQKEEMINMAHLGPRAFEEIGGEVVQTTAFVLQKHHLQGYKGCYARLIEPTTQDGKEAMFLAETNRYTAQQDNFSKIPGAPVAYWVSEKFIEIFERGTPIDDISITRQGIIPGNIDAFVRLWHEVSINRIGFNHTNSYEIIRLGYKWFPYNKGGAYRRWSGNIEHIINMENDGYAIKNAGLNNNYRLREPSLYFKEAITWSKISSGTFSARYMPVGCLFDIAGCCIFDLQEKTNYTLSLLNSSIITEVLKIISPTLNYEVDHIKKLPVIYNDTLFHEISYMTNDCIDKSKKDWDSFETSWDFKKHPMI